MADSPGRAQPAGTPAQPAGSAQPAGTPAPPAGTPALGGGVEQRQRNVARIYTAFVVVLIPWTIYLGLTLPRRSVARHYDLAWVGFDCLIVVALARTAWLAWRGRPSVVMPAVATATLLMADAWFDVVTSSASQVWRALLLALVVELPCAALSLGIAHRAITHLTWARDEAAAERGPAG